VPFLIKASINDARKFSIWYYWDASKVGLFIASITSKIFRISIKKLEYKIQDVRDHDDLSILMQTRFWDSMKIKEEIVKDPLFKFYFDSNSKNNKLKLCLIKLIVSYDVLNTGHQYNLLNPVFMIRVSAWKLQTSHKICDDGAILFIRRRKWHSIIEKEALKNNIMLVNLPRELKLNYKQLIQKLIPTNLLDIIHFMIIRKTIPVKNRSNEKIFDKKPRIATEYSGHLNIERPECYSDLFFLQRLLIFNLNSDPLNREKYAEMRRYGIKPVAISPNATEVSDPSLYYFSKSKYITKIKKIKGNEPEIKWMSQVHDAYSRRSAFWGELFEQFNIKIYTSWYKYDDSHLPIAEAMEGLGGVTAFYQRSYESMPSVILSVNSDIMFGFSKSSAKIEKLNGSSISYHVTTGYLGDHRFSLLRTQAERIRKALKQKGANHIMAYFDENTIDDSRWFIDHASARKNYTFLLEKVLQNTDFGLVLKPKTPASLLRRLGPVTELLENALETGRCFIYLDGAVQGSYPPAAAALVADVSVHDGIGAVTAGLESALCGVPTLLIDEEGCQISNLYELGVDKVVFNGLGELWETYNHYIKTHDKDSGFGDWSKMLNEMDPFRDGRSAERIGTYLKWLLDGFQAGMRREAAGRYCRQWGNDKIISV